MALGVVMVMATPALAQFKLNGYYRWQGNAQSGTFVARTAVPGLANVAAHMNSLNFLEEDSTTTFFDNRLRLMATYTLNDNIGVVYFGEIDTPWGEASKGGVGGGGQVGGDGVNVETKHAYVNFKIPNSNWAVRTGLQGWGTGNEFEDLVVADDMAGINFAGKLGSANVNLIYSKWQEGNRSLWDERDFYAAKVGFKPSEQFGLTGLAMYLDDNRNATADDTTIYGGLSADFRVSNIGLRAFAIYADSDWETTGVDGSTWMADIAAFLKLSNGQMKLHAAYFPDDLEAAAFRGQGQFEYHNDNLQIMLTDIFYNNGSQGALALDTAAYSGFGLMFATISGDMKLPQDSYLKYGLGYFSAVEEDNGTVALDDKSLGTEAALMIGKKFAEKYDLSLRGSYVFLGDAFDTFGDLDDPWKAVAMVNVGF
jgi:hypothetical protein